MTITIEAELTIRVPDMYECTDPDFAYATVTVTGALNKWKVKRAVYKFTGDEVEKSVLSGKNNTVAIIEAANTALSKLRKR